MKFSRHNEKKALCGGHALDKKVEYNEALLDSCEVDDLPPLIAKGREQLLVPFPPPKQEVHSKQANNFERSPSFLYQNASPPSPAVDFSINNAAIQGCASPLRRAISLKKESYLGRRHGFTNSLRSYRSASLMHKHINKDYKEEISVMKQLFRTLANNSVTGDGQTIDKATLLKYLPLPGLLGERLFSVFDHDNSGGIDFYEFLVGLAIVYGGSPDEKKRFLFHMFDLDGNGLIEKEELRTLLTHVSATFKISRVCNEKVDLDSPEFDERESIFREAQLRKKIDDIVSLAFHGMDPPRSSEGSPSASSALASPVSTISPSSLPSYSEENAWFPLSESPNLSYKDFQKYSKGLTYDQFERAIDNCKEILEVLNLFYVKEMPDLPISRDALRPNLLLKQSERTLRMAHRFPSNVSNELYQSNSSYKTISTSYSMGATSDVDSVLSVSGFPSTRTECRILCCPMCSQEIHLMYCLLCGKSMKVNKEMDAENNMECPHCQWNAKSIRFCSGCGQPLQFTLASLLNSPATQPNIPYLLDIYKSDSKAENPSLRHSYERRTQISKTIHPVIKEKMNPIAVEGLFFQDALKCGYLLKVGRKLGFWVKRYCVVKDRFLYTFLNRRCKTPRLVAFLQGSFVGHAGHTGANREHGIEIIFANGKHRILYAYSADECKEWLDVLRRATQYHCIHDFYVFREPIGQGEFSIVYRATHKRTQTEVAVKVLQKANVSAENREFMRNEVNVLKLMIHPNVVRLFDVFDSATYLYMVMEHIEARDLSRIIAILKDGRVAETLIRHLMYQLLKGLLYIHQKGIVHRDVKPENILVKPCVEPLEFLDVSSAVGLPPPFNKTFEETIRYLNALLLTSCVCIQKEGNPPYSRASSMRSRGGGGSPGGSLSSLQERERSLSQASFVEEDSSGETPVSSSSPAASLYPTPVLPFSAFPFPEGGNATHGAIPLPAGHASPSADAGEFGKKTEVQGVFGNPGEHAQGGGSIENAYSLDFLSASVASPPGGSDAPLPWNDIASNLSTRTTHASTTPRTSTYPRIQVTSPCNSTTLLLPPSRDTPAASTVDPPCVEKIKTLGLSFTCFREASATTDASLFTEETSWADKALFPDAAAAAGRTTHEEALPFLTPSFPKETTGYCEKNASNLLSTPPTGVGHASLETDRGTFLNLQKLPLPVPSEMPKTSPMIVLPRKICSLKITDFGLSKLLAPTVHTNEALGTLAYVAPEILRGDSYDKSVDLWSVGVVCFELLSGGELPFVGQCDQSLAQKILCCDFSFDSKAFDTVSDAAKDFITRLLDVSPVRRLNCAAALHHPWFNDNL